jgi:hypothetical protein
MRERSAGVLRVTRLEAVEALLDGPVDWKLLDAA